VETLTTTAVETVKFKTDAYAYFYCVTWN